MSLPIELYWEIFRQSDFVTTLRLRSTCKEFDVFHTPATEEHSQVKSTLEAVKSGKIILLKAMSEAKVPQYGPKLESVLKTLAIGHKDQSFFQALIGD